eukprot:m.25647 g.25647  ORF g.25647 m.25647 type:complete len:139 (+) comp7726_c0_seq2:574-990(+)
MYVFLINIQVITMGNRKSAPRSTAHSKKESEGSASAPKPLPPAIHTDAVNSVTFCGSPWVVASGGQDNKIVVSDWKKEKKACSWQGHSRGVTKVGILRRFLALINMAPDFVLSIQTMLVFKFARQMHNPMESTRTRGT